MTIDKAIYPKLLRIHSKNVTFLDEIHRDMSKCDFVSFNNIPHCLFKGLNCYYRRVGICCSGRRRLGNRLQFGDIVEPVSVLSLLLDVHQPKV